MEVLNLGMVGGGTVGSGVFHALQQNGALLAARIGIRIHVRKVAVKSVEEPRPYPIPRRFLTTNWREVVEDPQVQLVTELVGGTTVAREVVETALRLGKPVITANKALLSAHGPALFAEAERHGTNLYFEASVCGGIPILKALREGFVGNRVTALYGIVNGTCNYILTRMTQERADFQTVLREAQQEGYAETPPDLDIDGHDAQHKTGILASLAHGHWIPADYIAVEGIRAITPLDLQFAAQLGYTIKLLGIVKQLKERARHQGEVPLQVSVYPALVPSDHVLARVQGVYNAVFVRGDVVGDTLFYGRGAGKDATASAVLSDLADAALDVRLGTRRRRPAFVKGPDAVRVVPLDDVVSRSFVRLSVIDQPGVLARIAAVFGRARIGIASVIQPEGHTGEVVPLILMLHEAPDGAVRKALDRIARLPVVKAPPVRFRVESLT
ncbi:MAG: homoserine dehydrogenase [Verrucomicrobiota bacterium]|nr:homoserine dehydrogenase [Limisphaera sp.]MDW8382410.1 homoserine dehydrogenase [Verrucomicrobiota bacterium]